VAENAGKADRLAAAACAARHAMVNFAANMPEERDEAF